MGFQDCWSQAARHRVNPRAQAEVPLWPLFTGLSWLYYSSQTCLCREIMQRTLKKRFFGSTANFLTQNLQGWWRGQRPRGQCHLLLRFSRARAACSPTQRGVLLAYQVGGLQRPSEQAPWLGQSLSAPAWCPGQCLSFPPSPGCPMPLSCCGGNLPRPHHHHHLHCNAHPNKINVGAFYRMHYTKDYVHYSPESSQPYEVVTIIILIL